jgi:hypothetical protein
MDRVTLNQAAVLLEVLANPAELKALLARNIEEADRLTTVV